MNKPDNPQSEFTPKDLWEAATPKAGQAGRTVLRTLLAVAVIGLVGFPIYHIRSQSRSGGMAAEAADQGTVQILTRLAYHTNGTASVWFEAQTGSVYRIDYADTKAATAEAMRWELAADNITAATNGWTEWVDDGVTNRPAPGEVKERYYRVVLKAASAGSTASGAGGTATKEAGAVSSGTSVPVKSLVTSQDPGLQTRWGKMSFVPDASLLQQCKTIERLVAGGKATEDELNQMLAGNLRIKSFQMFMNYGRYLYRTGDRHHAQLVFEAMVQHHAKNATKRQLGRCYLWLGAIHQDEGLEWKYQRDDSSQAKSEFEAAVMNYQSAKDVVSSQDWVRVDSEIKAAACYREVGDQDKRREYLEQVLKDVKDVKPFDPTRSLAVSQEMAAYRDVATYQRGNSYYEQGRWAEAAEVFQQMHAALSRYVSKNPEQYPGQKTQLDALQTGLDWCAARQAESQAKGQVAR